MFSIGWFNTCKIQAFTLTNSISTQTIHIRILSYSSAIIINLFKLKLFNTFEIKVWSKSKTQLWWTFLTLTMPNVLNGIIHLTFLALSIIMYRDIIIKMKTLAVCSCLFMILLESETVKLSLKPGRWTEHIQ